MMLREKSDNRKRPINEPDTGVSRQGLQDKCD